MKIHEEVKLQLCYLLHHLCDVQAKCKKFEIIISKYVVGIIEDSIGSI